MGEKSKPNCFTLGPVTDSSALRTYYVSCGKILSSSIHVESLENLIHFLDHFQYIFQKRNFKKLVNVSKISSMFGACFEYDLGMLALDFSNNFVPDLCSLQHV